MGRIQSRLIASFMGFDGFVLTRHWRDEPEGVHLDFWLKAAHGPVLVSVSGQESVGFITQSDFQKAQMYLSLGQGIRERLLPLKAFNGERVHALYFKSQRVMLNAKSLLEEKGIPLQEGDIRPAERFLMERFITGSMWVEHGGEFVSGENIKNPVVKASEYWPALSIVSLDIETSFDGQHLYSIAVYGEGLSFVMMVEPPGKSTQFANEDTVSVKLYENEKALLQAFSRWVAHYDPDIFIGWNVVNFDFRFLQKKYDQYRLAFNVGRNLLHVDWRKANTDSEHYFITIPGRVVLDGIDTLKAATYNFESFSLENVARQLLGRGKLIDHVEDRGDEIMRLFREDPAALARYNLEDCRLVWEIFEKAHLMHFAIQRARLTGLPLDKIGGSVAAFENLYLPRLHRRGYIAPNVGMLHSDIQAPGGYVMDSAPGLYKHVLVLDFKSLYPSIIRTFRIDPLSLIHSLHNSDGFVPSVPEVHGQPKETTNFTNSEWIPGFNNALFSKQAHLLPDIIEKLWKARDQAKAEGDQALSQAIKIIMNSFYGVLGTPLCRFYDPRLSSSITLRGHDIMQQSRELIEAQGYQVIYGDTDSVFVWLKGTYRADEVDQLGDELAALLNKWWRDVLAIRYGLESFLEIEYETHYSRFHMPKMRGSETGSKKRYAGLIEKAGEDVLVFKGLENVRTDWTQLARDVQYQVYWRIFHDLPIDAYLISVHEQVMNGQLDHTLFYRKRLRRPLNDYKKNIPPHVQAARKADFYFQENSLKRKYQRGGWIEYLITVNGPEPKEHCPSTIDYEHYIERQIAPAVDGILTELGTSFAEILNQQLSLF